MKESNPLYHGSNLEIRNPLVIHNKYTKDFGDGFYLTDMKNQAEKWAKKKSLYNGKPIVNIYYLNYDKVIQEFKEDEDIKYFKEMNNEWLDFIARSRHGDEIKYQIIEGPMADDQIYNFVERFLTGEMSREDFWTKAKFLYPTHQIVLKEKALKCLDFIRSYEVE